MKNLLRKGYERFDTPTAMKCLELDEPEITARLSALQQSGWIEFLGVRDGVDWWRPGMKRALEEHTCFSVYVTGAPLEPDEAAHETADDPLGD